MPRLAAVTAIALATLAPSIAAAETDAPSDRSPTGAFAIAAGSTALGLAISVPAINIVAGATEGGLRATGYAGLALALTTPSMGHVYAGEYKRAAITTGLRAAGALVIMQGTGMISDCEICGTDNEIGLTLATVGAGVIAATTIYDLYDAPRAARRTNARHLMLTPTALPAKDGVAPAFALSGSF